MTSVAAAVLLCCCVLLGPYQTSAQGEITKVSFGATITSSHNLGPFNTQTTVVFNNVLTNVGGAYNAGTGIFTAPTRGVYFFTFTGHSYTSHHMLLQLMKNRQQIDHLYIYASSPRYHDTASNSMTLTLEKLDQVYLRLGSNTWIYHSTGRSSFNGFLLYPL